MRKSDVPKQSRVVDQEIREWLQSLREALREVSSDQPSTVETMLKLLGFKDPRDPLVQAVRTDFERVLADCSDNGALATLLVVFAGHWPRMFHGKT
jgi:hypothetical protein